MINEIFFYVIFFDVLEWDDFLFVIDFVFDDNELCMDVFWDSFKSF